MQFVVVGGLAVNAWGLMRGTKDVDIVVAPDIDNLKGLAEVAVGAGGHVHQVKPCWAPRSRSPRRWQGHLKAMKHAAGRTRDLADLEDLEAAGD